MNLSNIPKKITLFLINRLIESVGFLIILLGLFLLISIASFSPEDPNFIFPDNTNIKNIFGFYGSYISDLILQSIGLISYLFSITIIINGFLIIKNKNIKIIFKNLFLSIIYIISGSIFFDFFYRNSFLLIINGNGGFVGNYFKELSL